MWHPFHLHGHTYQHAGTGPRKDTSIILPGRSLTVEFDADNPGLLEVSGVVAVEADPVSQPANVSYYAEATSRLS